MAASGEDPTLLIPNMATGVAGVEGCVKAYNDGTDELRDLLKNEVDIVYECRYCRNFFRSIANLISHKRTYCKTYCRTTTHAELIAKHVEEVGGLVGNGKNTPPTSVKKNISKSRHNIVAPLQKKLTTTTIGDKVNRVDLYTLPGISRYQPQTIFQNGEQQIIRDNPQIAIKEHLSDNDKALLIMPQDSNTSQHCGDMTLRRRKLDVVEGTVMSGKELIILDYIPTDIRKHINPATCQCLYDKCENFKPFGSLFALAYHLTLRHNRPLSAKEISVLRKGREGFFLCFLCNTTHGSRDKLITHIQKEHAGVRKEHIDQREKAEKAQALRSRARRKLEPSEKRFRSISPTLSESEEEGEDTYEPDSLEPTNMEGIDEETMDSITSSKSDTKVSKAPTSSSSRKGPIVKKKKRARLTMKRKKPVNVKAEVEEDSAPMPQLERQVDVDMEDEEEERENENDHDEEEAEKEDGSTPESQNIPELSQVESQSASPSRTRSPSPDSVALRREKRTSRKPRKYLEDFDDFVSEDSQQTKRQPKSKGYKEPPKKKPRSATPPMAMLTPKQEVDEETSLMSSHAPVLEREPHLVPTLLSPNKIRSRLALSESIQKAKGIASAGSTSAVKKLFSPMKNAAKFKETPTLKAEFDNITESWVTPDNSFADEITGDSTETPKKKAPFTPNALAAREGSSRRKQRLNISDDHEGNTPRRVEMEDPVEEVTKPIDLSSLTYEFTPEHEELFFKALKSIGTNGAYQCSECARMFLNQEEGRRHMISHVRCVRFRCALCDVGAFYCDDMRNHLMYRHCPSLHLLPDKQQSIGSACMTVQEADELTHVVHPDGQYLFTSGKIVTSENYKPHRPDHQIEENIMGDFRPACISPKKHITKVPILSRTNKSPSRLVGSSNGHNSTTSSKSQTPKKDTRHVTPLKLIRKEEAPSATTSSITTTNKLPTFKILNRQTLSLSVPTSTTENAPSTSAAVSVAAEAAVVEEEVAAPSPQVNPPVEAEAEVVEEAALEAPAAEVEIEVPPHVMIAPIHPPTPPQPVPLLHQEDIEPSDPLPSVDLELEPRRSMDPVDPSPSF